MLQRTSRHGHTQQPQAMQHTSHRLLTLLGMANRLRLRLLERGLLPLLLGKRPGSPGRRCLSGCRRCRRRLPGAAGTAAGRPAGGTVLCSRRLESLVGCWRREQAGRRRAERDWLWDAVDGVASRLERIRELNVATRRFVWDLRWCCAPHCRNMGVSRALGALPSPSLISICSKA